MIKKDLVAAYQTKYEHAVLKKRVMSSRRQLTRFCEMFDEPLLEYTGWFVLLKKDKAGDWSCVGFYNPDSDDEDVEPEWDLCMPIPKPESVKEFQGWWGRKNG